MCIRDSTYYMKSAAVLAGIECKVHIGQPEGWSFDANGRVMDQDGVVVDNIWKTWAWRTIVDSLGEENDLDFYLVSFHTVYAAKGIRTRALHGRGKVFQREPELISSAHPAGPPG